MSRIRLALAAGAMLLAGMTAANAGIVVTVDKTAQRLTVSIDGYQRYEWPVSTARMGYRTPNGTYRPQRLERMWHSRLYDWSPMPYSIFFNGGYAIHGTYEVRHLGSPASHGCIRLNPQHAAILFALVRAHVNDTRIVVTGDAPRAAPRVVRARPRELTEDEPRPIPRARLRQPAPQQNFEDVFGGGPRWFFAPAPYGGEDDGD